MYRIVGDDQKTYGPVSAEQVRRWLVEGRADQSTLVQAEGTTEWKPLSAFPVLGGFTRATPPPSTPPPISPSDGRPVAPPANSLATAGLILGIASLFCGSTLFGIAGMVCSGSGLNHSRNDRSRTGREIAIAGLAVSGLALALHLFGFVFHRAHSVLLRLF